MHLGRAEHQLGERQLEQGLDLVQRPVVARLRRGRQGATWAFMRLRSLAVSVDAIGGDAGRNSLGSESFVMGAVRPRRPDREIELKFLCAPADLAACWPRRPTGTRGARELITVYFDTPGRPAEGRRVAAGAREQGPADPDPEARRGPSREEHEAPDRRRGPIRPRSAGGAAAGGQRRALKPAFNVGVIRRQRLVRYDGAEIEIALDRARSAARAAPPDLRGGAGAEVGPPGGPVRPGPRAFQGRAALSVLRRQGGPGPSAAGRRAAVRRGASERIPLKRRA